MAKKSKKQDRQESSEQQEWVRPAFMLGIDLGGTKILAAVVDHEGRVIGSAKRKTHAVRGVDEVIDRIARTARDAVADAHLEMSQIWAVGIGAPGVADYSAGVIEFAPNLDNWVNIALGPRLQTLLDLPVFVENDVNAGTYGEAAVGVARGYRSVVGVFPGTGIGGGIIIDGRLLRGAHNAGAEIGHMVVMIDGPQCGCGRRGCIEALASRTAIERDIIGEIRAGRSSVLSDRVDLDATGQITSGVLKSALDQKDSLVTDILERAAYHLGIFTASVVNAIDPECIVYGGGLIEACGDHLLPIISDTMYRFLIRPVEPDKLPVLPAALGDNAVLLGAAMLARASLNEAAR
ncbi:ROK family protein [Aggregatilinea lenta]|uniref:ROK family protein n=1 Tax=Aggregatilinea lenta TaxID=913108 RepID=UPI0013C2CE40|nr:ROK family protein [Aggregatilinea lenta]